MSYLCYFISKVFCQECSIWLLDSNLILMKKALKQQNSNKSHRSISSHTFSASIQDLRTQSEDTMSSQATVYTDASQRMGGLNNGRSDYDDYEDIMGEQIDTLFITAEQQKKIQNILQFARKGTNAFELPVRVIDPQVTETTNMRFWKFASELLYASMSIYDKRVENVFLNTNKMFDNLIRIQGKPDKPLTEEEIEDKDRKQRGTLIHMDVGEIGMTEHVSTYEIAKFNCEEEAKINIKNLNSQFIPDPLFNKRLQAFDSGTLKSLFLNVFECGEQLQVMFFKSDDKKGESKVKMQIEDLSIIKQQEIKQEDLPHVSEKIPQFIYDELQKLNFIGQNSDPFKSMQIFRHENLRGEAIDSNMVIDIAATDMLQFKQNNLFDASNSESHTYSLDQAISDNNTFQFNFDSKDITQVEQFSQDIRETQSNLNPSPSMSDTLAQFMIDDDHSMISPWQLQFKGSRLQRKKIVRHRPITSIKQKNKKEVVEPHEIYFNNEMVDRKAIFKVKSTREHHTENQLDKFLAPKSMDPFLEVHKKRQRNDKRQYSNNAQNYLAASIKQPSPSSQQPFFEHNANNDENYPNESDNNEHTSDYGQLRNNQQNVQIEGQSTQTYNSNYFRSGIRNIREIKEKIYQNLMRGGHIRLSEIDLHISPASILIIFLHLANEQHLEVESIQDQTDIRISYRGQ